MTRQILFRGRRLDDDEWVYGDLEYNRAKNISRIHVYDEDGEYLTQHLVEPESVGQYTGYDDCQGMPMYEGDIVKIKESVEATVEWAGGGFHFYGLEDVSGRRPDYVPSLSNRMRVIGTIHDSPNLLNGK